MRVPLLFVAACLVACSGPGAGQPVLHAIPSATGLDASMDAGATPDSTDDGLVDVAPTDASGPDDSDSEGGEKACSQSCIEQACGVDPCGDFCGSCPGGLACLQGQCVCVPSCPTSVCGDDGCGGSCGECDDGEECASGECVPTQIPSLLVQLLWSTPADSNPGDTFGTDLDLHLAHEEAAVVDADGDGELDPWFDATLDCFSAHPNPNWGDADSTDDDPSLERDDVDGEGPEQIAVSVPEPGVGYTVGVHYINDKGLGPSIASVRIYLGDQLVGQSNDVTLEHGDLWDVAIVVPSTGFVKLIELPDGEPHIIADYPLPQ